jgi:hypothetical protein
MGSEKYLSAPRLAIRLTTWQTSLAKRSLVVVGNRLAPLLILGLAGALRLHNLAWNSLDNDEGFSWAISRKPLPQLLSDSLHLHGDPHPPVYWMLLKGWTVFAGTSEFSMRLLSVFAGLTFVALVFYLSRRLFSRRAGLAAMIFAALSPHLIRNSQDARMYSLGGTLALAGVVCLVNGLQHGLARWWLGYFALTALACYTHLAGSFLLPFHGLLIVTTLTRLRRVGWPALLALLTVGLSFLPYALNAWRASGPAHNVVRYFLRYDQLLHNATLLLSSFEAPLSVPAQWVVVLFVGSVFILGFVTGRERLGWPSGFGRRLVAFYFLAPLFVIYLLSLREPIYHPKSLTFVAAAFMLGVGAGWERLWRRRRTAAMAVGLALVGIELYGLSTFWRREYQKEDWRHAAAHVARQAGLQDAVLIHLEYYKVVFTYYFHRPIPVIAPLGSFFGSEDVDRVMQQFKGYETVWLVQSGEFLTDPNHWVQTWLEARYPAITEVYPAGILVKGFAVHYRFPSLPAVATPLSIHYPNGLSLIGYRTPETRLPANDLWLHPPSAWVHVTLYWSVAEPLQQDIRVSVTLEDEVGNVWGGDLPRDRDLWAFYPPLKWQPGEVIRQDFDVNTNPILRPGEYKIVVRVYADGSETPLIAEHGADWVIVQRVELTR